MALLALAVHLLPALRLPLDRPRLTGAPALRLLRHPVFLTFLAASACLQSTHAMLYTFGTLQIGRASCRERVCQYLYISVVAGSLYTKQTQLPHLSRF